MPIIIFVNDQQGSDPSESTVYGQSAQVSNSSARLLRSTDAYVQQLVWLMPRGPAWSDEPDSQNMLILTALAEELTRLDNRTQALLDEADPRSTIEMLPDWEREFGMPPDCISDVQLTLQQRYQSLLSQITGIGGQSIQYFETIAQNAGYTVSIVEFAPFTVTSGVDDPIYDISWRYAWQVNSALNTVSLFNVRSAVSDPLGSWGNERLECLINRFKPSHSVIIFSYT